MTSRILTGRQMTRATGVIALSFVLSGVLGIVRQAVIGGRFGAGYELDAFYAAYRIPEMLFTLVAGGALGSAFIPVYARFLNKNDVEGASRLASAQLTLIFLLATVLTALAGIFSPWITAHILIPEASASQQALTSDLTRLMLCTVIIFSASGLIMGILNANQHFLTPALAPSMNNVGLIIGALFLVPLFHVGSICPASFSTLCKTLNPVPMDRVYGLAFGAIMGALLHLAIQLPSLLRIEHGLRPLANLRIPGVIEVFTLMGPRVLGSAVVQINFIVNTALASGMAAGSLTALTVAFGLMFTVLGILGQSVGTAVFPTLSALVAQDNMDGFRQTLAGAIRSVLFMSLPATIGLLVLAKPLVSTIYEHGAWSVNDTIAAAWALRFFALGLSGFALQEVLARAFYALRDTKTPVIIGSGGMILNVILSLILIRYIHGFDPAEGPFGGLALANSAATMVETAALWIALRRRSGGIHDQEVLLASLRVGFAALAMGLVVFAAQRSMLKFDVRALWILLIGTVIGGLAFEASALLLQVPEARTVPQIILRRFKGARSS